MVFENLEVQNNRQAPRTNVDNSDSFGVHIHNTSEETLNNFVFKNMTFKNVYAIAWVDPSDQQAFNRLKLLELGFLQIGIKPLLTMFWLKTVISQICKDLEFMPSTPGNNSNDNRHTNFVFRGNEFKQIGGTCILPSRVRNCLIENNIFDEPGATNSRMIGRAVQYGIGMVSIL